MTAYFNITEIELVAECSVGYLELRRLKLKHTWHLTPCLLQIINGRLPTGSTNFDHNGLSGRFRTLRAMPNSAHVMTLV